MRRRANPWKWIFAAGLLLVTMIAAISWQSVALFLAAAFSERRPALLADAAWDDPGSAHMFNDRFARGVPRSDLMAWLDAQHFAVNGTTNTAERRVKSFPCNERILVSWGATDDDRLKTAEARVQEAGCL